MIPQSQQVNSEYVQSSFAGGMNIILDDTRIGTNQYRIGFNCRNRYDKLDLILSSKEDVNAPIGIKQEMTTFGNYEILFVSGLAYYKYYTDKHWIRIDGFQMSPSAPRFWTKAVPVSTTNYCRLASSSYTDGPANAKGAMVFNNIAGASAGNLPGLIVQDNINQPRFIYLGNDGVPISIITQTFNEWSLTFTDPDNVEIAVDGDKREYVPIGNVMEYVDGVLYIASPNGEYILQSVTGRPLDFVRNVTNALVVDAPYTQVGGGDAYTTAYSVGVGGITCLKALSDSSLFVAAANANFSLSKNYGNNVPLEFGEFPLIRKFLFNANCLSDRAIIDTTGDTRFIDLTGVRSFNAISQLNNEGRNSIFTQTIQPIFIEENGPTFTQTLIQIPEYAAAVLYDNYEIYALTTIFGPVLAVYDTINSCWTSLDLDQTGGKRVKQLVKIELAIQALFAITEDNKLYRLYAGPGVDLAKVRIAGIGSSSISGSNGVRITAPKYEVQLRKVRVILNNITQNCQLSVIPYVNNRMSSIGKITKQIDYTAPPYPTTDFLSLGDVDDQLENLLFSVPNCEQGWKVFCVFEWTGGSITQFSCELNDLTPMNPLSSQHIP